MADVIIPPIGTKGLFRFSTPFDNINKISSTEELSVVGVRTLKELYDSGEKPKQAIYLTQNLTEKEYEDDLINNVPTIVFKRTNGDYIYIPSNRILSLPDVTGYRYRGMILAINLGSLPIDFNLDTLIDNATALVYDTIGIKATGQALPSGVVTLVTKDDNDGFLSLIGNRATVTKSYKTLWNEQVVINAKQTQIIKDLEEHIKKLQ